MILTVQQLWADYDRKAEPLDETLISKTDFPDKTESKFYFNGLKIDKAAVRVYARLIEPAARDKNGKASAPAPAADGYGEGGKERPPVILVMDDIDKGADSFNCGPFLKRGWAVLIIDYAGENSELSRYTLYPKALSHCNAAQNPDILSAFPTSEVRLSRRYVYAVSALRALTFIESLGYSRAAFLGGVAGGLQSYKIAYAAPSLVSAAALYSEPTVPTPATDEEIGIFLEYKTALENESYCPHLRCPFFMQLTSNERDSSLDRMNELYLAATSPHGALLSVSPKTDRRLAQGERNNIEQFLASCFNGETALSKPSITARGSGGSLHFIAAPSAAREIESVKLYYSHNQPVSAYRNWICADAVKGAGEAYSAKVTAYSETDPVYAFAQIQYKNYLSISTAVISVIPKNLGVAAAPFTAKRLVYDADMGLSEWQAFGETEDSEPLKIERSPDSGIEGISSSTRHLATFILADNQYKGPLGSSLQPFIYTPADQKITFSITVNQSFTKYVCEKSILNAEGWTKILLLPQDFRADTGALDTWDSAVLFEVSGEREFLINSILWV